MFDSPDYPKTLQEETFETWLDKGRDSKIGYEYMLVIWDDVENEYRPVYAESRDHIKTLNLGNYGDTVEQESVVAIYDLFSEARIGGFSV